VFRRYRARWGSCAHRRRCEKAPDSHSPEAAGERTGLTPSAKEKHRVPSVEQFQVFRSACHCLRCSSLIGQDHHNGPGGWATMARMMVAR
jgi:hypothetical protein